MKEKLKKLVSNEKTKKLLFISIVTFLFGFVAFGFSIFNPSTSVDSHAFHLSYDANHQYAIGRIFQPFYRNVISDIHLPLFAAIIWLVFLSLAIFVLCNIFDVENKWFIVFLCGILTVSNCFVKTTNYFPQWNEVYSLCLLISSLSVYFLKKYKFGFIIYSLLNVLVMGLYQSYSCVSIGLVVLISILELVKDKEKSLKDVFIEILKAALSIVVAAIIYFILYKTLLKVLNVEESDAYNSSTIYLGSIKRTLILIGKTYILFFRNLVLFSDYQEVGVFKEFVGPQEIYAGILLLACIGFTVYYLIKLIKLNSLSKVKIIVICLLLMLIPFGFSCVCIITNGNGLLNIYIQNFLVYLLPMTLYKEVKILEPQQENRQYSLKGVVALLIGLCVIEVIIAILAFVVLQNHIVKKFFFQSLFVLIIPIYLLKKVLRQKESAQMPTLKKMFLAFLSVLFIFNSIIYATRQGVEYYLISQRRLSALTTFVTVVESNNDFDKNTQSICVYGDCSDDLYIYGAEIIDSNLIQLLDKYYNYVQFVDLDANEKLKIEEQAKNLPNFPSINCTIKVGDYLVVKFN